MKNNNLTKWIILAVLALTWGSSFILIKKSVAYFNPITVGAMRAFFAGIFLLPFGIIHIRKIPKKTLFWVFITGLLGNFIPMFLFPIAEKHISSSLAGILNSLVPVFVLVFGFIFFKINIKYKQIIGIVIGFLGATLLVIFGEKSTLNHLVENPFFYALLVVLASIMYALSALIIKQYLSKVPSFQLSSVIFSIYFLPSILILFIQNKEEHFLQSEHFWEGIKYVAILGIMGTAFANMLFYKLIQMSSSIFASSVTYLMPIIALLWGVYFGENIGFIHIIGMLIILAGVYLIQDKRK